MLFILDMYIYTTRVCVNIVCLCILLRVCMHRKVITMGGVGGYHAHILYISGAGGGVHSLISLSDPLYTHTHTHTNYNNPLRHT